MPLYEYKCEKCGIFERLQKGFEVLEKCPVCKSKVKKLLSSFRPVFKGSGFYETDYKRKKKSKGKDGRGSS